MQTVVGVVRQYGDAQRILAGLQEIGLSNGRVSILSPKTPDSAPQALPTTDAESAGRSAASWAARPERPAGSP